MALIPVGHGNGPQLHRAARIEDAVHEVVERRLVKRGWEPTVIGYAGYGAPGWVRVMARVLLSRPVPKSGWWARRAASQKPQSLRGWRSFATVSQMNAPVTITAGGVDHQAVGDRGGFVDAVVPADLKPGWQTVTIQSGAGEPVEAPVQILEPGLTFGVISDIDDTVMVTALPRPMLAAWNTFVLDEHARASVPGMAVLYERLRTAHPGAPVFYLSTGAWNVAPALTRFLRRHLYPVGPLLLTDWGPTKDRWFRSGPEHKRLTLERLSKEFPQVRWLLIGDDGQHDPEIYAEFASKHPDNVAAVAIRRLSPAQAVLAGGLPSLPESDTSVSSARFGRKWLGAPDGAGLSQLLTEADLL
ncbi:App1 family protein [Catenuloplanes japonicus]|uniref:App1 family protein n=1 Tax=Catenuloplanes japonicus TaxID=33876 RepID=UPI000525B6B0|nr:phosphatase domain-containing protein [Catenuloplanes japonicus]